MKKTLVALALVGLASTASAKISGGSHDLSATGSNPAYRGTLSACQYCHAPHNANTTVAGAPLWNRNAPATNSFTVYTSNTFTSAVSLGANSLTCLSCHDGQSAMGSTYVGTDDAAVGVMAANGYANVGTDLRNDHPVGVVYPTNNQFQTANIAQTRGLKLYAAGANLTVECGSCHDPHGLSNGATGGVSFLRVAAATICTDCHDK